MQKCQWYKINDIDNETMSMIEKYINNNKIM